MMVDALTIARSVAETSATKADLELAKHELRADIQRIRTEVERTRNQLPVWIMSALVAFAGQIIGVVKL